MVSLKHVQNSTRTVAEKPLLQFIMSNLPLHRMPMTLAAHIGYSVKVHMTSGLSMYNPLTHKLAGTSLASGSILISLASNTKTHCLLHILNFMEENNVPTTIKLILTNNSMMSVRTSILGSNKIS